MTQFILQHSQTEHVADGVMHVLGVAAAIAGVSGLLVWVVLTAQSEKLGPLIVYAIGILATFSLSAAYNMTLHGPTRALLRKFDHAAIYLMIAGTYTPMALIGMGGTAGWCLTGTVWVVALTGIVLKLGFFDRVERIGLILYMSLGWAVALITWPLLTTLPGPALALVIAGGITYTLGTVFHLYEPVPFSRAIWHGHVLAAAATHFAAVILIVRMAA
ncbi:DNA-binding protein [Thioclava sp. SK-1]|uniref:PAQR family membrane homeostasis protein TrhA n=1 Tax=Thioclava sp. SK-1 TaxID=1889770 RepID=UPI000826A6BD|nr:hemolysin III family protein [Thioclava sp. SK-1]OCX66138.1 DNA-binding protein [Thioclava sp. SK-1]